MLLANVRRPPEPLPGTGIFIASRSITHTRAKRLLVKMIQVIEGLEPNLPRVFVYLCVGNFAPVDIFLE